MTEAELQIHVVKLLAAYGRPDICFWHCPNGELRSKSVGARLKAAGVRPGVSDLNFVVDGRFHAVELKIQGGKVSAAQLAFKEDLERAGGFFHVAFGLDQAIGLLKGLSVFRPNVAISFHPVSPVRPWRAAAPASPII